MRRPRLRTFGLVLLVLLALGAGGWLWYTQPQPLLPEATASLASTADVTFSQPDRRLEWAPSRGGATTGLIVYPGGKVPPAAYGPLAQSIAREGFLVVIVPMPFNLAVFGIGAADGVVAAHPEITAWAIGGHSLGGSVAAQYASDHLGTIKGLAFWASYGTMSLAGTTLKVVSVYGTLDAGAPKMSGAEARAAVPPDAMFVPVEGGNHEQMGWYTGQPNDPPATIARADQQATVAAATVEMLNAIGSPAP